jgi:hypothetical protein
MQGSREPQDSQTKDAWQGAPGCATVPQSTLQAPQSCWLLVTQNRARTGDDTYFTFMERRGVGGAGLWSMLVLSENYIKYFEVRSWAGALQLAEAITATPLGSGSLRRTYRNLCL